MEKSKEILVLLEDSITRDLFASIVRNRRVKLETLIEKFGDKIDIETAKNKLNQLRKVGLIEEKTDILPEWNIYLITAMGLEANRRLEL